MNEKLINKTRDAVIETSSSLTERKAKTLFESAFPNLVLELTPEAKDVVFQAAKAEADGMTNGGISWPSVFNSYVALMRLAHAMQEPLSSEESPPLSELAQKVFSSDNRMGMLFYIFRTEKDLPESAGRALLEAAFPTALNGLQEPAKEAIFTYAYERSSSLGWGEVVEGYTSLMDIVSHLKPSRLGSNVDSDVYENETDGK